MTGWTERKGPTVTVNEPAAPVPPATPEPPAPTEEAPPEPKGETPERLPDDHPVVKALAKANKEAEQARLKVKEFEDRDLSEQERLTKRSAELQDGLTKAQADAAKFEIALDKGLTKSQAKRLQGSTREELEADADELLADLGVKPDEEEPPPPVPTGRRSKEVLTPGATPGATPPDVKPGMARLRQAYESADK